MAVLENGVAGRVLSRGCQILYDSLHISRLMEQHVEPVISKQEMSEAEFVNAVNDFCFHNVWAMKKLLRRELWTAKMCVDCYLKNHLLKMIELYCAKINGTDVRYDD